MIKETIKEFLKPTKWKIICLLILALFPHVTDIRSTPIFFIYIPTMYIGGTFSLFIGSFLNSLFGGEGACFPDGHPTHAFLCEYVMYAATYLTLYIESCFIVLIISVIANKIQSKEKDTNILVKTNNTAKLPPSYAKFLQNIGFLRKLA